jgi:hypothetical protein
MGYNYRATTVKGVITMDPVVFINLSLCIIIFVMGLVENARSNTHLPLYVGIAFGLFGISHLLTLIGLAAALSALIIAIRLSAYVVVIYSLYLLIGRKQSKQ